MKDIDLTGKLLLADGTVPVRSMSFMNRSLQASRTTAIIAAVFWLSRKIQRKNPQTKRNWKSREQTCRQSSVRSAESSPTSRKSWITSRATSKNVPRQ